MLDRSSERSLSESSDESRRLPGGLLLPLLTVAGILLVLTFWILSQAQVAAQSNSQFSTVLDTFSPTTAVSGSATFGLVNGTYPVANLTVTGDAAYTSTVVPSTFLSLQSFDLVLIPQSDGGSRNYDVSVNYGTESESITIHSDSDLSSVHTSATDVFQLLDLSSLLSELSPSDIIGVEVSLGDNHPLQVVGVKGEYQTTVASTADPLLDLEIGIDCSGFTNGGTLTTTGSGVIFCANDDIGSAPAWGDITGTLSNQTDLQSALDGKQATGDYITALTGDVTAIGPGSVAGTIANQAVTFAKFQNIAQDRLLGRISAGTGSVEELTAQNIRDLILGYYTIQDEGGAVTQRPILNFAGAGVECLDDTTRTTCTISGAAGTGYQTIEEEGVAVTQRTVLNFTGGGITCVDDGVGLETDCDVPTNTVDTGPSPDCSGTTTYQDGEGNCDTLDGLEDFETPTDDGLVVGNGTGFDTRVLGDCTDTSGNHLNYTIVTNAFSCGTSSSVTDTNAQTVCTGTDNYLDGEGNCDVLVTESTTGGRSTTLNGMAIDADAELYTDTKSIWFEDPTAADDFQSIWGPIGFSVTITSISCESDQTVVFDLQIDDGTPAAVNGSDITCTTFATDSTLAGDTGLDDGERLDLAITSVSGTPTFVSIWWTFTKND